MSNQATVMEYRYRLSTFVIAIIDLVFSIVGLVGFIGTIGFSIWFTVDTIITLSKQGSVSSRTQGYLILTWFASAFLTLTVPIYFIASVKLLYATLPGQAASTALKQCTFWRVVSFVYVCLGMLSLPIPFYPTYWHVHLTATVIGLLIRVIFIWFVNEHMSEVRAVLETSSPDYHYVNNDVQKVYHVPTTVRDPTNVV